MFEVAAYENRCIYVRHRTTGHIYQFEIGQDGTLMHGEGRSDLGEARRVAIEYLFRLRRSALLV
jgi:hypothetical protein